MKRSHFLEMQATAKYFQKITLLKSYGDKISHFEKWWGHVPSVPSVNYTCAADYSQSLNHFVYKMSENYEKCSSQFSRAPSDSVKLLLLYNQQTKYLNLKSWNQQTFDIFD